MIRASLKEIAEDLPSNSTSFPKYVSGLLNQVNRITQATRPKNVGQMTELFKEFKGDKYSEWVSFYKKKMPKALDLATEKIYNKVKEFETAVKKINRSIVKDWVEDLVLTKTFVGLGINNFILKKLAEINKKGYRLATKSEESKGIDGYIGNTPVSIKPDTYIKIKPELLEKIKAKIIFYHKTKEGIEFDEIKL